MGQKEPLVERNGSFLRILHIAGSYNYLIYEWIQLKESSIIMFLVVSAVKELL